MKSLPYHNQQLFCLALFFLHLPPECRQKGYTSTLVSDTIIILYTNNMSYANICIFLQFFDTVGRMTGSESGQQKQPSMSVVPRILLQQQVEKGIHLGNQLSRAIFIWIMAIEMEVVILLRLVYVLFEIMFCNDMPSPTYSLQVTSYKILYHIYSVKIFCTIQYYCYHCCLFIFILADSIYIYIAYMYIYVYVYKNSLPLIAELQLQCLPLFKQASHLSSDQYSIFLGKNLLPQPLCLAIYAANIYTLKQFLSMSVYDRVLYVNAKCQSKLYSCSVRMDE